MPLKMSDFTCLPLFRSTKGEISSSALIVEVLAYTRAMTVAEIHRKLYAQFKYRISYQGTRKLVTNLHSEGVLKESNGNYQINKTWLLKARAAIDILLSLTTDSGGQHIASLGDMEVYKADSLFAADLIWGDILREICSKVNYKGKSIVGLHHHAFWMPLNLGRETELFTNLMADGWKVRMIFSLHSKLNDWAIRLYREMKVDSFVKNLKSIPEHIYYNIIGEYVIELSLDSKLTKVAKNISSSSGANVKVNRLTSSKGEITLKIQKNKVLAEALISLVR